MATKPALLCCLLLWPLPLIDCFTKSKFICLLVVCDDSCHHLQPLCHCSVAMRLHYHADNADYLGCFCFAIITDDFIEKNSSCQLAVIIIVTLAATVLQFCCY